MRQRALSISIFASSIAAFAASCAVIVIVQAKVNDRLDADFAVIYEHLAVLSQKLDAGPRVETAGLALAESPSGPRLVDAVHGISSDDLDFLQSFRGPLLPKADDDLFASGANLRDQLAREIEQQFAASGEVLSEGRTSREALIAFAVLRTNGSMPTYAVRNAVPNSVRRMIAGTSGNCSDFTVRLMYLLEAIGVEATFISINTPSFPGHVVVSAYDPQEDTSYVLDANFNVMITERHAGGVGLIQRLVSSSEEERADFAANAEVTAFPVYFRFVHPGDQGFSSTAVTADSINERRSTREADWRMWMQEDIPALIEWWANTPAHQPRTLNELREIGLDAIPDAFDISGDRASSLRAAASLSEGAPS